MVRWGVLGAGSVAQRRVMPAMQELEGCSIGALSVRDQARADSLAGEFGAAAGYSRVESLFEDAGLDAIIVSSPVHAHVEHAVAAAEAGKHVLCEKPMALDVDGCQRIIDACKGADVRLGLCFVLRGWPIYQRLKKTIADGDIGQFVSVRAHLAKWVPWDKASWRRDPSVSGGGVLPDVGSHYLDLFRFLFGEIGGIVYRGSNRIMSMEVEETAHALVSFEEGGHGLLSATIAVPHNGNVLEIYGTKGSIFVGQNLKIIDESGEREEPIEYPDYYSGILTDFGDCVEKGSEPLASGQDGLRNTELIVQAYDSAR